MTPAWKVSPDLTDMKNRQVVSEWKYAAEELVHATRELDAYDDMVRNLEPNASARAERSDKVDFFTAEKARIEAELTRRDVKINRFGDIIK